MADFEVVDKNYIEKPARFVRSTLLLTIYKCLSIRRRILIVGGLLLLFGLLYFHFNRYDYRIVPVISQRRINTTPVIMAWTRWFTIDWVQGNRKDLTKCPRKCIMAERRDSDLSTVDAMLFHTRDLVDLPRQRFSHQLYVFWMLESPVNAGEEVFHLPLNFFNASVTYLSNSTYPRTYSSFRKYKPGELRKWTPEKIQKVMSSKKNASVIFSSNCDTHSKREEYIEQLEKYTKIDKYGKCYEGRKSFPHNDERFTKFIGSHMFYLAFENSVCTDYITEKFFNLQYLVVPIVLKRKVYENLVPDGVYIAADDFKGPKELGDHLNYLMGNNTAYMEYFSWTSTYDIGSVAEPSICKLCEDLYEERERTIPDIQEHFLENKCDEGYARKLIPS